MIDVLGIGCAAVDEVLHLDEIPPADGKARVRSRETRVGGLVATALIAAARQGARCAYAGVLGGDDLSELVRRALVAEGVDVGAVERVDGAGPVRSTILNARDGARTILFDDSMVRLRRSPVEVETKVLLVDHLAGPVAAQVRRRSLVADFEGMDAPGFEALFEAADHLILSRAFAAALTGAGEPAEMVARLRAGAVVAVTAGECGLWYRLESGTVTHLPAFPVHAVDTTGCGDVLHGAYAAALARDAAPSAALRHAAAAAALKAASGEIPVLDQVMALVGAP